MIAFQLDARQARRLMNLVREEWRREMAAADRSDWPQRDMRLASARSLDALFERLRDGVAEKFVREGSV